MRFFLLTAALESRRDVSSFNHKICLLEFHHDGVQFIQNNFSTKFVKCSLQGPPLAKPLPANTDDLREDTNMWRITTTRKLAEFVSSQWHS